MPGAYTSVVMFPETESVFVVLSNTLPLCHMFDWIVQLLIQTLFDFPVKNDYLRCTKRTVQNELAWYDRTRRALAAERTLGTQSKDLNAYVGRYTNTMGIFNIDIFLRGHQLFLSFQGRDDEIFELNHYEYDTFCWLKTRNELAERGRMVLQHAEYYLFAFEEEAGSIRRFRWRHDFLWVDGEYFVRKGE